MPGLFDGGEGDALKVFAESELRFSGVVEVEDAGGYLEPSEFLEGGESVAPGDEHEAGWCGAQGDGVQEWFVGEGVGEFGDAAGVNGCTAVGFVAVANIGDKDCLRGAFGVEHR